MESRMLKFYSKESNQVPVHAMQGHFATSNSHINYYIDITSLKTRTNEAREAAKILKGKIPVNSYVDTIVCIDSTEVIGAFLAEEIEKSAHLTTNRHETIYIVSPEENRNGQMIFRDNNRGAIEGKHIVLLSATVTTGETIRRSMECIRYYGGVLEVAASVFSTVDSVDNVPVQTIFGGDDIPGYASYRPMDCPFCKKGEKIEAMVNAFGYSRF